MFAKSSVSKEDRMDGHKNARLTWHSRVELVRRVLEEKQTRKAGWQSGYAADCKSRNYT